MILLSRNRKIMKYICKRCSRLKSFFRRISVYHRSSISRNPEIFREKYHAMLKVWALFLFASGVWLSSSKGSYFRSRLPSPQPLRVSLFSNPLSTTPRVQRSLSHAHTHLNITICLKRSPRFSIPVLRFLFTPSCLSLPHWCAFLCEVSSLEHSNSKSAPSQKTVHRIYASKDFSTKL